MRWGVVMVIVVATACGRVGFAPTGDGGAGMGDAPDGPPTEFATLRSFAVGSQHACAVRDDGAVWCWGNNFYGQLGDGTTQRSFVPRPADLPGPASRVFAGSDHSCALLEDGRLWCWGGDVYARLLGIDPVGWEPVPQQIVALGTEVVDVAVGSWHLCARKVDQTLWCWGGGTFGLLGHGTDADELAPRQVAGLTGVISVAAGRAHTCAAIDTGEVLCWGNNTYGQLGSAPGADVLAPAVVSISGGAMVEVVAGRDHTCARNAAGGLWCWGEGDRGQLGDDTQAVRATPAPVLDISDATALAAGNAHTCAIRAGGALWCWGLNFAGAIGDGTSIDRLRPVAVQDLPAVAEVAATSATCARTIDDALWCWGLNSSGQLGIGRASYEARAAPMILGAGVTAVAAGWGHTCVVTTDGATSCVGWSADGQLGTGSTESTANAAVVAGLTGVTALGAGQYHSAAVRANGTLATWGDDTSGQLGIAGSADQPTPVEVGLAGVADVALTREHTCARTSGGALWCWGANASGQLGINSVTASPTPVQVTDLGTTVAQVAVGGGSSCAVDTAGVAWCWGANPGGKLGDGTIMGRRRPTRVDTLPASVAEMGVGYGHACARLTDGTVWCAGSENNGELGNGPAGGGGVAVQVLGLPAAASSLSVEEHMSCAALTDGRVFCWGSFYGGSLGDGTSSFRDTAVEVVGLTGAVDVTVGGDHACARRDDGSLWCWGNNRYGQLGRGYLGDAHLPVRPWLPAP